MLKIKAVLMRDQDIRRAAFFWNAFSAVMNSFQTMLLLLVITRLGNMDDSGIFVIAYAIGNLMINIGKYGVRQFQVTDVNEKYSFFDYIKARYVSMLFMAIASAVYLAAGIIWNDYSVEKALVILIICIFKGIEAYEDVYHGRMQQQGRLDVAGRILGIRLLVFIIGFAVLYILTHNLLLTCVINLMVSLFLFFILNYSVLADFQEKNIRSAKTSWTGILVECFPLCVCFCLNMYVGNAPKYTIDSIVSNDVQTCFNIVFMPVFVVALLGNFVFQPFLKSIGEKWENLEIGSFFSIIIKLALVVIATDAIIAVLGSMIGCEVLGWIYNVNLKSYRKLLVVFLLAGGIIALQNLFMIVITAIRCQKYMIYGYIITAAGMLFAGKRVLLQYELIGLSSFFLLMLAFLGFYCMLIIFIGTRKQRHGIVRGKSI